MALKKKWNMHSDLMTARINIVILIKCKYHFACIDSFFFHPLCFAIQQMV